MASCNNATLIARSNVLCCKTPMQMEVLQALILRAWAAIVSPATDLSCAAVRAASAVYSQRDDIQLQSYIVRNLIGTLTGTVPPARGFDQTLVNDLLVAKAEALCAIKTGQTMLVIQPWVRMEADFTATGFNPEVLDRVITMLLYDCYVAAGGTSTINQLIAADTCYRCLCGDREIRQVQAVLSGYVVGSAVAFSPLDISGLKMWLKSESIVGAATDPFPTWADSSGLGNNATTFANVPTVSGSTYNGNKSVLFNGDFSDSLRSLNSLFSGNQSRAMFVVYFADTALAGGNFRGHVVGIDDGAVVLNSLWITFSNDATLEPEQVTAGSDIAGILVQGADPVVSGFTYNGAGGPPTSYIRSPASLTTQIASSAPAVMATVIPTFLIGRDALGFYSFYGDICEVIVYQNNLTPAQIEQVINYLAVKFDILPP